MQVPPKTGADFDAAYRRPVTVWGDSRIPGEISRLIASRSPRRALELGCGLGRFSEYVAQQGVQVTGVDFSSVAISRAQARVAKQTNRPDFMVGDVTHLEPLAGPFEVAFDVGCFHCLGPDEQRAYAAGLSRLLAPAGMLLIWAMDSAPSGIQLSPPVVAAVFEGGFQLMEARKSRRRVVASHWYWLAASN